MAFDAGQRDGRGHGFNGNLLFSPYFCNYQNMEMNEAVIRLASLAQESRLTVFRLLAAAGDEGVAAGEIAHRLEIPPATLSFHLNHLRNAGLIEPRRESRSIIYTLRPEAIRGLLGFLTDDCCQGRPELCQPSAPMGAVEESVDCVQER